MSCLYFDNMLLWPNSTKRRGKSKWSKGSHGVLNPLCQPMKGETVPATSFPPSPHLHTITISISTCTVSASASAPAHYQHQHQHLHSGTALMMTILFTIVSMSSISCGVGLSFGVAIPSPSSLVYDGREPLWNENIHSDHAFSQEVAG